MDYDNEEGPGPQLSVELLSSIWTAQNGDSEASSNGDDIPAVAVRGKGKRKRQSAKTVRPFESVKLKRPQRTKQIAINEPARKDQGRQDINVIPNTPKAPQQVPRNPRLNTLHNATGGKESEESGADGETDVNAGDGEDEKAPLNEDGMEDETNEEAEDEAEAEDKEKSEVESEKDDEVYGGKKGHQPANKGHKYMDPNPSTRTPRRSSRLIAKSVTVHRTLRLRTPRNPVLEPSLQALAQKRRRLTEQMRKALASVEVAASSNHTSLLPTGEGAESDIGKSNEASLVGQGSMDEDAQSGDNRPSVSSPKELENGADEEASRDSQSEHGASTNNESGDEIQIIHESGKNESDGEVQSEHESDFGDSESENDSRVECDFDAEFTPLQNPNAADFWSAARLFGQHTNWADLLAEAKKLIPGPSLTQKSRILRKLLAVIAQAKQLYARTGEIRQDYQIVPDHLDEAEKSNAQQVVDQVSYILSRVRIIFDEKGSLVTTTRDLERNRQTVHEIIGYAVPELVGLLKLCITAHYIDHELSVSGIKQLTQLLQSLYMLCEKIQPKFFRPFIHFGDTLQNTRVVVRFLWTVFYNESNRLQAKQRLERFNSVQQKRTRPSQNIQSRHRTHQATTTPTATDDEQYDKVSLVSIDESSAAQFFSEGPYEFPWTTAESEALVTGLERYQGINRYTMILRDFKRELAGRTMEDLRVKAREIRDSYVAAMQLENRLLDAQQWGWLLEV
ncbi:hypothetical protein ACJ72_00123 [Emergomyces africanus]|uniref:Myb-like domain-containing protein n=1 Tax=Emergomyces africanus TaxID=1955775 RepID=A0A1B7P8Z0_9EURO|nr:hypothetical protein ACJ72_00123 [Emergomyces africanus]